MLCNILYSFLLYCKPSVDYLSNDFLFEDNPFMRPNILNMKAKASTRHIDSEQLVLEKIKQPEIESVARMVGFVEANLNISDPDVILSSILNDNMKQKLHQIVTCQYFNGLSVTYLSPWGKTYPGGSCKMVRSVRFLFKEGES